jgi:hypothetical protein
MQRCVNDAKNNQPRLDRDRADWLNLLFYRGGRDGHWVVFDRATNSYVPRGTDPEQGGLPEWVPRCVTNMFGLTIDGIVAILDQSEPAKQWYPSTDDDADRATAEVAEDADPVLLEEIGYDSLRAQMHKLIALTNGCALILWFDNDPKYGMEEIPLLRCPNCSAEVTPMALEDNGNECPPEIDKDGNVVAEGCGTPGEFFEPVIDQFGEPRGIPYPKGRIRAQLAASFEYSLPSAARVHDAAAVPWVLTHSEMPTEEVIGRWRQAKDLVNRKGGTKSGGLQRAYARNMRQLSSPTRATNAYMGVGAGPDGPVVFCLQHDPIDDGEFYFPDGLLAWMVEDELMEAGPLTVIDDHDCARKSILLRTFAHSPGSPFGKPPADDLVPLQVTRNMTESLMQLILMHDAAPTTYIPLSVTLENQPTGRPGETVFFRSVVPGERPVRERGVNPPEGLFKYLEIIDQKFQEVSKLNAVLVGQRPEGDPTLGEVQILQERGMAAFKEPLDHLVRFEKDLSKLLLWIARDSAWSDRFRQVRGENGQWEISQFNAADLTGKCDLQIEKQTAWPKSPLMRMLRLGKAMEMGVLPPAMQDPELQTKLLSEFDLAHLKPSMDNDRKQIARELDRWKAAHDPSEIAPPDPTTQELPVHMFFKKQFLKTEEFEALRANNPPLAQAMVFHVQQIEQLMMQAAMAQAAAQNPPPPDDRTPAEKGDGSAVEAAIESGALRPAGEPEDPMAGAIESGAIVPAGVGEAAAQIHRGPSIDELSAAGVLVPAVQESRTARRAPQG